MSYTVRRNEKNMVELARAVCYMCKHAFMDRSGPVRNHWGGCMGSLIMSILSGGRAQEDILWDYHGDGHISIVPVRGQSGRGRPFIMDPPQCVPGGADPVPGGRGGEVRGGGPGVSRSSVSNQL